MQPQQTMQTDIAKGNSRQKTVTVARLVGGGLGVKATLSAVLLRALQHRRQVGTGNTGAQPAPPKW